MVTYAPGFRMLQESQRQMRGRPVRIAKAARRQADSASEFPEGVECDCSHCVAGVTIPGATVCCTSHLSWTFVDPWTGDERVLNWIGGDQWATDKFSAETDEGCSNEYVWLMDLTAETLALTIATDNGCDKACIVYKLSEGWECQCDLEFYRHRYNVPAEDLACYACVKPGPPATSCQIGDTSYPALWTLTVPAWSNVATGTLDCSAECDEFSGTFTLFIPPYVDGCSWYSCIPSFEGEAGISCTNGVGSCIDLDCGAAIGGYGIINLQIVPPQGHRITFVRAGFGCDGGTNANFSTYVYSSGDAETGITLTRFGDTGGGGCLGPDEITLTALIPVGAPTGDGSCEGCGEPDTAPIDDEGACCKDGQCLDIDETTCGTIEGTWYATDAECSAECGGVGTCCFCTDCGSADCVSCLNGSTLETCNALNGIWTQAFGDVCGAGFNDCGGSLGDACDSGTTTFGACCCGDGECANNVSSDSCNPGDCTNDCSFHDGCTTFTADTDCADVVCTPADIGCCSDDGSILNCENITEAACDAKGAGWTWTGPPAECCDPNNSVICDTDGLGQGADPC